MDSVTFIFSHIDILQFLLEFSVQVFQVSYEFPDSALGFFRIWRRISVCEIQSPVIPLEIRENDSVQLLFCPPGISFLYGRFRFAFVRVSCFLPAQPPCMIFFYFHSAWKTENLFHVWHDIFSIEYFRLIVVKIIGISRSQRGVSAPYFLDFFRAIHYNMYRNFCVSARRLRLSPQAFFLCISFSISFGSGLYTHC